jgi:hypothetical protein
LLAKEEDIFSLPSAHKQSSAKVVEKAAHLGKSRATVVETSWASLE